MEFYVDDHAALIGYLAKSAEEAAGEKGLKAIARAMVVYGRERGLRCAMRCLADGGELSGRNFLLYGEWADDKGWNRSKVISSNPHLVVEMERCGWHDSWGKYGLEKYGALLCDWIDHSLLYGFNPQLRLGLSEVLTHGGCGCRYEWVDAVFADDEDYRAYMRLRAEMVPRVTKDFLYHCGHVYATFHRVLLVELGLVAGRRIVDGGLTEYARQFGEDKSLAIVAESRRDFLTI